MAVLYNKYRPQTFSEVVSQKYIVQTLKNQVASGQVAHAYLFTGSRGVGKTSIARIFAKSVNCQKGKDGEPCQKCEVCLQISKNNFLDLVEIDAASNTGVDNIRDLIEHVKFGPSTSKYKVFIIDEVHMLSKGAFNALLKTLEEPPKHAIFILATTEINKVPPTIISRTQRFDFKRLSPEDLEGQLEKVAKAEKFKLPKEVFRLIAENADGSVRDSLTLLDKVSTLGGEATIEECRSLLGITDFALCVELLGHIMDGQADKIPDFFQELTEKGIDYSVFNRDFLEFLRSMLVFQASGGKLGVFGGKHQAERLKLLAGKASIGETIFIIRLFLKSYKDLTFSPNPEVPLLVASLEAALKKTAAPAVMPPSQPVATKGMKVFSHTKERLPEAAPIPVAKKPADSPEPEPAASAADLSLQGQEVSEEEVRAIWPEVVAQLKEANGPLANLIKTSPIQRVSGSIVVLGVKFAFHKQNLENKRNQQAVSQIIEQVSGKRLGVRAELVKEAELPSESPAQAITDALKIFGGEMVE